MAIHPMLPVLVAASLAGLLLPGRGRRRPRAAEEPPQAGGRPALDAGAESAPGVRSNARALRSRHRPSPAGIAWAVLGLAVTALLAPALTIPEGVPSPAAILARHPPWQEALAPGTGSGRTAAESLSGGFGEPQAPAEPATPPAGNPALSDVVYQIQPWLIHLRRELRAGRAPFWNPYQYSGAPFWSNGQSAPLFPLHLLFAALPLGAGLVLLPWLKAMIAGLGARALARELGTSEAAALFAGITFGLSGMLAGFLLYPMGNALALVPWVLWAVERLASGRSGIVPLAVASGLQLLAGHPETALHTALLSGIYLLVRGAGHRGAVRPAPRRAEVTDGAGPAGGSTIAASSGGASGPRAWSGWAAGWTLGAAQAAVQLVPLALELMASARWQAGGGGFAEPLGRLLVQPLRLVLPDLYGDPARGTWFGPYNYLATAAYAGALALPLAAMGISRVRKAAGVAVADAERGSAGGPVADRTGGVEHDRAGAGPSARSDGSGTPAALGAAAGMSGERSGGRAAAETAAPASGHDVDDLPARWDRRWLAVVAVLVFSFAAAYHLPGVRHALEALPVIGRAAHHRLIFGVALALALLAAAGLDRWRAGLGGRALATAGALVALLLAAAWWHLGAEWAARGLIWRQAAWSAGAVAAISLLAAGRRLGPRWRRGLALALPAVAAADLLAAHGSVNPGLPLDRLFPETPAVRFLQGRPGRIAGAGDALRPNAAMVYRLHDVRGDDTVKSARWARFEAERMGAGHPHYFTPIRRWDALWLDRLGVRWVIAAPAAPPPDAHGGWRLAYDGADARVWERPGAMPPARWTGPAEPGRSVEVLARESGRWRLRWQSPRRGLLVVAESFDPGWSAWTAGAGEGSGPGDGRVPVRAAGEVLIGLELGPGAGEVDLVYRPAGFVAGAAATAAGLLAVLAILVRAAVRRRSGRFGPLDGTGGPQLLPPSASDGGVRPIETRSSSSAPIRAPGPAAGGGGR